MGEAARRTNRTTPSNSLTGVSHTWLRKLGDREVVVADPSMRRLYDTVERIALTSLPVLICGETGTGKELVAEAIHLFGPRALKPLVRINCAALPPTLIESELFGHERGTFTGAWKLQPGLLEKAAGGTLFLDEISELPIALQAKLLRVLESSDVRRLGGSNEHHVDLRVVAASNRNLQPMIDAGEFREDLYHRISTFLIEVPPLRERRSEIALFAEHFARELCRTMGHAEVSFGPNVHSTLEQYRWPGNVRELRNVISRSLLVCDSVISRDHLPVQLRSPTTGGRQKSVPLNRGLRDELREFERRRIVDALRNCNWNQTEAAKLLHIPRRTLVWKLAAVKTKKGRE